MKKLILTISIAFLISIIIHFLLYSTIDLTIKNSKLQISTTSKKQTLKKNGFVNVKYVKIKKKKIIKKKKTTINKQLKLTKEIQVLKKKLIKVAVKKKIKRHITKKQIKPIKLPKVIKQTDLKSLFTISKKEQQDIKQKEIHIKEDLQKRQKERQEIQQLDRLTQSYIKLYGEQYFRFSETQKKYLKNNLSKIGKITQRYLRYPRLSVRTRQSGINIIEFLLHPNGDITNLKLSDSSNYTSLDDNSLETIYLAYKDYPKPFEIVKIKIYVQYILR